MIYNRIPGLVSVVIPSYNYARYAVECLDSLRAQRYKDVEIVLVDDCSTDSTVTVVESWANHFNGKGCNFTMVKLPRHVGYAGALTIGFYLTTGEYIAIQDLDDISAPDRIQKQIDFLAASELDMVGTNVAEFTDGQFDRRTVVDWISVQDDIKESYLLGRPAVCSSTLLFKGIVFDMVGGLSRHTPGLEDMQFIKKCMESGAEVGNLPEVLYYARMHPAQRFREIQSH